MPSTLTLLSSWTDTTTSDIYTLSLHDALPIYIHAERPSHRNLRTNSAVPPASVASPDNRSGATRNTTYTHPTYLHGERCAIDRLPATSIDDPIRERFSGSSQPNRPCTIRYLPAQQ